MSRLPTPASAEAAVRFAAKVTRQRGRVSDEDLEHVRLAGYDDAGVIEIVMHVALNTWTNYVPAVRPVDRAA